jgi:hypothetical protein
MIRFLITLLLTSIPLFAVTQPSVGTREVVLANGGTATNAIVNGVYDPLNPTFGVTGGADDTSGFSAVFNHVPYGSLVRLTSPGIYTIDTVLITNRIALELGPGVVLRHKAAASGDMLKFTIPPVYVRGGTFDGNAANQTTSSWYSLIHINPLSPLIAYQDVSVQNCVFTNFVFAGTRFDQMNAGFSVEYCTFVNGKEHGGILGLQSQGVHAAYSTITNGTPHVKVNHNRFIQSSFPSSVGRNPGGFIIAGSGTSENNVHASVEFIGNFADKIGQTYVGNHIGTLDLYEDVYDAVVEGNTIRNNCYTAFKLQNGGKFICSGNVIDGDGVNSILGIWYDPHQRNDTNDINEICLIENNIVKNQTSTGIAVAGNIGLGRSAKVSGNWVENCATFGVQVGADGALVGFEGPISLLGNTVKNCGSGIYFTKFSRDATLIGNEVYGGTHGLQATVDVTNAVFTLANNYLQSTNSGGYPLVVFGAGKLHLHSGIYESTTTNTAINISADVNGVKIGELFIDPDHNFVRTGSKSVTLANVTKWTGPISFFGDPTTQYTADIGTRYTDLTAGSQWVKVSNNGATNGWAQNGPSKWQAASDGNFEYQWFKADGTTSLMRMDGYNQGLILGPANTYYGYRLNIGEDIADNALLLALRNGTAGGAPLLELLSDTAAGGIGAWSSTHAKAWMADKVGIIAENNASAIALSAHSTSQTIDFYAGSTTRSGYWTNTDLFSTHFVYVSSDPYGSGWNGNLSVPTKDDIYDKIETITAATATNSTILVNGSAVTAPNLQDGSTATFTTSGVTNINVNPTNISNAQISASAAISRSKISSGTANHIVINDGAGNMSSEALLGGIRFPALSGDVTTPGASLSTTIANNAITTAKIAANSVDGTKIALGSDAQGDVMFYNGTDWARLGAGTSGQVLATQGAAANPHWVNQSASGAALVGTMINSNAVTAFAPATYYDTSGTNVGNSAWGTTTSVTDTNFNHKGGVTMDNLVTTNRTQLLGFLDLATPTTLTLSSDAITITSNFHLVDTEGGAATDNLSTINGTSTSRILFLRGANNGHIVTIKHNVGNIWNEGQVDMPMNVGGLAETYMFIYNNSISLWVL